MAFDARQGLYLPQFGDAVSQGISSGQDIRAKQYELSQKAKMQDLQQAYLGASDDKQKQGILQQMAVYSPEHAKGVASMNQMGVNPFEGTSMEAQKANLQYQRYIAAGYPPGEARINAINDAASVNAQYYTDPMGNRVTIGGSPLPEVGGRSSPDMPAARPVLGGAPDTNNGMLGGAPVSQGLDAPVSSRITDDVLASATPDEIQFAIDFAKTPVEKRGAFYAEQAKTHPDLPGALTPDVEEELISIGNKLSTSPLLPKTDKVSQQDMQSPLIRKERALQQVGKESLQAGTNTKIEEKLLNSTESLARVKEIRSSFKPEYLRLGARFGAAASSMKDFLGADLSAEETTQLSEYTGFKRASVDNLNRLINELSGQAMGVKEAERIAAAAPNSGVGIFDGDSPIVFKRKMDDVTRQMQHATLRYNYALKNGMNPLKTGISLDKIPELIEKRGAEIESMIKKSNPNLQQDAIDMQTKLQLGKEFGMQ